MDAERVQTRLRKFDLNLGGALPGSHHQAVNLWWKVFRIQQTQRGP